MVFVEIPTEQIIFQTNWIAVKRTPRGFDFLERKGKDSVAIFLLRKNELEQYEVLVRLQPLCVLNAALNESMTLFPCPITGGIDLGETVRQCAAREVFEETGYSVDPASAALKPLGTYIVGTQTNEICYLFWADVTGQEPEEATQDGSVHEAASKNEWRAFDSLRGYEYVACQLGYFKIKEFLKFNDT